MPIAMDADGILTDGTVLIAFNWPPKTPSMPRIEIITEVRAPIDIVFDLSRSIDAHQATQTSHNERAVAGRITGLIELGEEVTWEATHFGLRQKLTSQIVQMDRPRHFRDSLVRGAFKRFDHDHFLRKHIAG